ncbi:MAG: CDP-diacylglycerol--serine O-phosphatidyltransferase [Halobacteriales archaeon]|nr:CDP-diacylglycerol--serine O-phosphatidyltransferase [Halobacteriales archaeon]
MIPSLLDLLEPPDFISLMNAGFGFIAIIAVAVDDLVIAASLILIGAIADGLDGIIAQYTPTSDLGVHIDSFGDTVTFGVAPALLAHYVARDISLVLSLVPIFFVLAAIVRLSAYNVHDVDEPGFTGVPSTFAGVTVAVLFLTRTESVTEIDDGLLLVPATVVLAYLMLIEVQYPELKEEHALVMGAVVALTALFPMAYGAVFPTVLLVALVGFLFLSPMFYAGR